MGIKYLECIKHLQTIKTLKEWTFITKNQIEAMGGK
jgi:hypothetical protein